MEYKLDILSVHRYLLWNTQNGYISAIIRLYVFMAQNSYIKTWTKVTILDKTVNGYQFCCILKSRDFVLFPPMIHNNVLTYSLFCSARVISVWSTSILHRIVYMLHSTVYHVCPRTAISCCEYISDTRKITKFAHILVFIRQVRGTILGIFTTAKQRILLLALYVTQMCNFTLCN